MFGGNGGLLGFTNNNKKNPKGLKGPSGLNGHDLPPPGSNGCPTKSCPPLWAFLYAYSQGLFPLEFVV